MLYGVALRGTRSWFARKQALISFAGVPSCGTFNEMRALASSMTSSMHINQMGDYYQVVPLPFTGV